MKTKNIPALMFIVLFLSLILVSAFVTAQEEDGEDIEVFGLELEKILYMINAWLAVFLFAAVFIAYKRNGRKRLLWVSLAFFLFAVKSFFLASELIFPEAGFIDPLAVVIEFFVLLSFFYGVLKK